MHGSQIQFFASEDELTELFRLFDSNIKLIYYSKSSEFNLPNKVFNAAQDLTPNIMRSMDWVNPGPYIAMDEGTVPNIEMIKMNEGNNIRYFIEGDRNPSSVIFKLGGEVIDKKTMVAFTINTMGDTLKAKEIFKVLKKLVIKNSKYYKGYYVSPVALDRLYNGWRLTQDIGYSRIIDLVL